MAGLGKEASWAQFEQLIKFCETLNVVYEIVYILFI